MHAPTMLCTFLVILLQTTGIFAADWYVTYYVQEVITVSTNTRYSYEYTYTDSRTVKAGVTPTATPSSTSTYKGTYSAAGTVQYEYLYLPSGAVETSDLVDPVASPTTTNYNDYGTSWVSPVVYTAPSSCPTPFTFSTWTGVFIPSGIETQLHPTSTEVASLYYTYTTAFLSASALPGTVSLEDDYYYRLYIASCSLPSSFGSGGSSSKNDDDDDDNTYTYCRRSALFCTSLKNYIIIIATVIPSLFVLGCFESYFWFHRLMIGKGCMRLGTLCWILISLWVICFTRNQKAKSAEDQVTLRRMWKAVPLGQKLKLWLKWGFRHKYPEELLGPAPRPPVNGVKQMSVEEWLATREQPPVNQQPSTQQLQPLPPVYTAPQSGVVSNAPEVKPGDRV